MHQEYKVNSVPHTYSKSNDRNKNTKLWQCRSF